MNESPYAVPEPLTQLGEVASRLHELYMAYQQAGFSEDRAFELARSVLVVSVS